MTKDISILLIEDESDWIEVISDELQDLGFSVAGTATTFESALSLMNSTSFDLALVDINMNGREAGIELGKLLHSIHKKPFIFLTSNTGKDVIAAAISASPSAYLVKPPEPTGLYAAIHSAVQNFENKHVPAKPSSASTQPEFFFVKAGNKYRKISWKEVVSLRAERNYTALFNASDQCTYHIRCTLLKTLAVMVPAEMKQLFVQVNRSEAVNISFVNTLQGDDLMTDFNTISVTSSFMHDLKEKLNFIA